MGRSCHAFGPSGGKPRTEEEKNLVRSLYGKVPCREIGAKLGRSLDAVQLAAKKLGLAAVGHPDAHAKVGKPWTAGEVALLVESLGSGSTYKEVGRRLGRSWDAVAQAAKKRGVKNRSRGPTDEQAETIRRLVAEDWPASDIARNLGVCDATVREWKKKLGLPQYSYGERHSARVRYAHAVSGATARGVAKFNERYRRQVDGYGWGPGLRLRHVQILDALMEKGAMMRREIADAIGKRWTGPANTFGSRDPGGCYLGRLIYLGLVIAIERAVRGVGAGKSCHLYTLSLTAERRTDVESDREAHS